MVPDDRRNCAILRPGGPCATARWTTKPWPRSCIPVQGLDTPPRPAYYFTANDPMNDKQQSFNNRIKDLGWAVKETAPWDASVINPLLLGLREHVSYIRFDGIIAYCLGRLVQSVEMQTVIVSDSWGLSPAVKHAALAGMPVTIAFFGKLIDHRWHTLFRLAEMNGWPISFFDLDRHIPALFEKVAEQGSQVERLEDLPPRE
jgi:hypothetical protein